MAVTILKAVVVLIIGFVLLVKGADFFVEGASSVAKMLKVPSLIIGMTIVAMGTSLPETSVSIAASMNNQNTLAVSNVVGSNIFNLMVVLGICAVISKLQVSRDVLKKRLSVFCAMCHSTACLRMHWHGTGAYRWNCLLGHLCRIYRSFDQECNGCKKAWRNL